MNVFEEAWRNTKRELKKMVDTGVSLIFTEEFIEIFNKHLAKARQRAREHQKELKEEIVFGGWHLCKQCRKPVTNGEACICGDTELVNREIK